MLWKLFGSERAVQEALEQSVGYDISPNVIAPHAASPVLQMPANLDQPQQSSFYFTATWEKQQA